MKIYHLKYYFIVFLMTFMACESEKMPSEIASEISKIPDPMTLSLTKEQIQQIGLELGKVQTKALENTLFVNGKITVPPNHSAQLHAYHAGFVQEIRVLAGDFVQKGQTVAVLAHHEFLKLQENYLTLRSESDYLQKELARQKTLRAEEINAEKKWQEVQRDAQIKEAQARSLEKQLTILGINPKTLTASTMRANFEVKSPISGYVEAVSVRLGEFVDLENILLRVQSNENKYLELTVFEKEIHQIRQGQIVTFESSSLGAETYRAEVVLIGQTIEHQDKTIRIQARISDAGAQKKLISGMFVHARVLLASSENHVLPSEAVIQEGNQYFAFIQTSKQEKESHFEKIALKITGKDANFVAFEPILPLLSDVVFVQKGAFYLQAQLLKLSESD